MDNIQNSTHGHMQRSVDESSKYVMYNSRDSDDDVIECKNIVDEADDLKAQEFTGHFTRGVKRSLQFAMTKVVDRVPATSCSSSVSATPSLLAAHLRSSSFTQISSPPPIHLLPLPFNPRPSPLDACRATNCSNIGKSHAILAHILTGEDKNLGASVMVDSGCADILSEEDKTFVEPHTSLDGVCGDVDSFLNDTLRSNSILGKFGSSANDWDLDVQDCPRKDITASSDPSLATVLSRGMSCANNWNKCATCLVVQNETKGVELRQEIIQALQLPDIKVIKLQEAVDVCSAESLNMIWVHVPQPIEEEQLAMVTSLIYSVKENKSTYFIAITDKQTDVDLHLHGFDEVYVEPIPKEIIHQKYQKFKFVTLSEAPSTDSLTIIRDSTSTPESTISLESVRTTEYSQSSTCDSVSSGMDISDINISDLKTTLSVPICRKSPFLSDGAEKDGRSPLIDPQSPPSWCRVEHATKEKQRSLVRKLPARTEKERRERIKDSCDQLRVLLPYVKGRKTDMASILEMTVDYLKIVNAALPQDFQSHVIDIMSNGTSVQEVRLGEIEKVSMVSKKGNKRRANELDSTPLARPKQCIEKNSIQPNFGCSGDHIVNKTIVTKSLSRTDTYTATPDKVNSNNNASIIKTCTNNSTGCTNSINGLSASKRECPIVAQSGSSKAKRPHMSIVSAVGDINSSAVIYVSPIKEAKKESILGEVLNQGHQFPSNQFPHLFSDGDTSSNRIFPSNNLTGDMFSYQGHTQMNTTSTPRVIAGDRADLSSYGGMYFDGAFYHYYSPIQDSSSGNYFIPGGSNEYVNPNAVLPMTTYTPRTQVFNPSHKFDRSSTEIDRFNQGDQNSEMFNNNCITGLKPNNS